ncbi:unnamed protein product [Linum trigynum]|uniref:Uncharacterized protein n=1 Tax=Linum trigynum TaxID=586398 RepID=A0AAV2EB88_9ROSI
MEGSLRLEEGRFLGGVGQTEAEVENEVETGLTLGPRMGVEMAQSVSNHGPMASLLYQHQQEVLEKEMGRGLKKRKGMGQSSMDRPRSEVNDEAEIPFGPAETVFLGGPGEKNKKKKNQKFRAHSTYNSKEGLSEGEQGRDLRAAVVRQKPPLRE